MILHSVPPPNALAAEWVHTKPNPVRSLQRKALLSGLQHVPTVPPRRVVDLWLLGHLQRWNRNPVHRKPTDWRVNWPVAWRGGSKGT